MSDSADAKPATMYDVARLAGVSHQTVSRLLQGKDRIRPELRERIEAAVRELGYRPNLAARSLATRTSHRIGALVYDMHESGPRQIMAGANDAARAAGYFLDTVSLDPHDEAALAAGINVLEQQDLAGILAFAPTDAMRQRLEGARFRVPIYVGTEDDDGDDSTRPNANLIGATRAVEHLVALGHRDIVHVSGPADWPSARLRARACRDILASHELTLVADIAGDWSPASGFAAARRLIDAGLLSRTSAIFCANDQMALGVLAALAGAGVSVPGQVSVIGMDDIAEAAYMFPSLSSVPMNFAVQGHFALERLLAQIDGRDPVGTTSLVATQVVQRASTAPPSPAP